MSAAATITVLHNNTATLKSTDTITYYAVRDSAGNDMSGETSDVPNSVLAAQLAGFRDDTFFDLGAGNANSSAVPINRTVVGTSGSRYSLAGGISPTSQDVGVYVTLTPMIGTELVDLDINFRILNHLGYGDNGTPIIARRTSNSRVKAKDGEEIVVSGLTLETYLNSSRKVPVLGSIPLLGYLFGGESKQTMKRMVVLVVKPNVMRKEFGGLTMSETKLRGMAAQSNIITIYED